MPIIFISKNKDFINKMNEYGFKTLNCNIEDFKPNKKIKTFYVLPGNSFGYMDTGLEFAYSHLLFINVQKYLLFLVNNYGKLNLHYKKYLPIGSSVIIDYLDNRFLVYAPCMLTPQNVHKTNNAYYSCIAALFNILEIRKEKLDEIDIIIPSICCGFGGMTVDNSSKQIFTAINNYKHYKPEFMENNILINEPNLKEQPLYVQNSQFKEVNINKLFEKMEL